MVVAFRCRYHFARFAMRHADDALITFRYFMMLIRCYAAFIIFRHMPID